MPETQELQTVESPEMHSGMDLRRRASFSQLTISDIGQILEWHDKGVSQVEMAQRLGKNQSSISRIISKLGADSSLVAKRHFATRAYRSAVRMTHIAEKGKPDDAIKAAKLVLSASGVTKEDSGTTINAVVVVGFSAEQLSQAILTGRQTDVIEQKK
jgi:hypothetical protein